MMITTFIILAFFGFNSNKQEPQATKSIYDYSIESIDGEMIHLKDFKGKKILFVNVASKCGFTPQYEDLEKLYEKYKDKLVVIGLPCNQFKNQEPGTLKEIKSFCSNNYGVTFPMTVKVDVKGENQHPIYQWLTKKELNGVKNSSVKWNLQKYLIDENGNYIDFFYSITKPLSKKITKYLD